MNQNQIDDFKVVKPLRKKMKFTQKEWDRFNKVWTKKVGDQEYYLDVQEFLCKKYDIILTDWFTRKQKVIGWMKKNLTQQNLDKGIKTMNEGIDAFTKEIDALTSSLGDGKKSTTKKNLKTLTGSPKVSGNIWGTQSKSNVSVWGKKKSSKSTVGIFGSPKSQKNQVKIWSEKPVQKKRKKKGRPKKPITNMERMWGTKRR